MNSNWELLKENIIKGADENKKLSNKRYNNICAGLEIFEKFYPQEIKNLNQDNNPVNLSKIYETLIGNNILGDSGFADAKDLENTVNKYIADNYNPYGNIKPKEEESQELFEIGFEEIKWRVTGKELINDQNSPTGLAINFNESTTTILVEIDGKDAHRKIDNFLDKLHKEKILIDRNAVLVENHVNITTSNPRFAAAFDITNIREVSGFIHQFNNMSGEFKEQIVEEISKGISPMPPRIKEDNNRIETGNFSKFNSQSLNKFSLGKKEIIEWKDDELIKNRENIEPISFRFIASRTIGRANEEIEIKSHSKKSLKKFSNDLKKSGIIKRDKDDIIFLIKQESGEDDYRLIIDKKSLLAGRDFKNIVNQVSSISNEVKDAFNKEYDKLIDKMGPNNSLGRG